MMVFRDEGTFGVLFDHSTLSFEILPSVPRPVADRYIPPRLGFKGVDLLAAPVRVYLEVTRRCNLECTHCFVGSSPRGAVGMSTDSWIDLMLRMKDLHVLDLRFTGGEITTRSDWFELVKAAKDLGFCVSVNTNGVYPKSDDIVKKLSKLALEQVTISLDGLAKNHNKIRGDGNFEKSLCSLRLMYENRIKTRVNVVLTNENVQDASGLLEKVAPFIKEINFFFMRPVGRGQKNKGMMIGFEEYLRSAVEIEERRKDYPEIRILHREQVIKERAFQLPSQPHQSNHDRYLPSCATTMNISSDGRYWPHGYNTYQNRGLCLGKYPSDDLDEVWNRSKVIAEFRAWQARLLHRCERCPLFGRECPGSNIEMEIAVQAGTISKNPYCASPESSPELTLLRKSHSR
jgi:MoaA/NifB/PqqE/SkfB family radical SAM enzyme